jgi:hypothetical protein
MPARRKVILQKVTSKALAIGHCFKRSESEDEKGKLCGSKSKGEYRCDFLAITWKHIFIAEVNRGRFIEPRWN